MDIFFKKKLLYKSSHRGSKETDILLGKFTKKNIDLFTKKQLCILDQLLDESDIEIFNWISQKNKSPDQYDEIITILKNFEHD